MNELGWEIILVKVAVSSTIKENTMMKSNNVIIVDESIEEEVLKLISIEKKVRHEYD